MTIANNPVISNRASTRLSRYIALPRSFQTND
jgi:hypothetical protein